MKAVLFDIDGTLLNSHEFIVSAFEHAVSSVGKNITRNEAEAYMRIGASLQVTYGSMLPEEDAVLLAKRHRDFQRQRFDLISPFEGAEETLISLRDAGFKIAAVTNRSRISVVPSLSHHKLFTLMDACICPEDTLRTKPDPEHILTALRALNSNPESAWMVGDTSVDIEAAHAAGVRSIGISHSGSEEIRKHRPTRVVFSLNQILPIVSSS